MKRRIKQGDVRRLVAVGVAVLLTGCTLASAEEEVTKTVAVKAGTTVRIKTRNGRVTVRPGKPGKVKILAVKKARATSSPRKLLARIKVTIKSSAQGLHIEADHPTGGISKHYGVSFDVRIPPKSPVFAETRNGSIRLFQLQTKAFAETRNGSIKARDLRAPVTLKTRNGSIRLEGVLPQFSATTRNGSVRVTLSGKAKLLGASRAATHNGSVTVYAPASLSASINASTHNGRIRSDFKLSHRGRRSATGTIGAGSAGLTLSTHNGSIRIRKQ